MLVKDPPVEVAQNLWMLGTNAYPLFLFQGQQEDAIFEGGIGAMGPVLREQFQQMGIAADRVKQVVVTHAHPDHVMAVPLFRQMFPQAAVVASAVAARTMGAEKAISFFCQMDDALTASLLKTGLIGESHRPQPLAEKQIPVDRVVKEGDAIVVEEASFGVLETPGHSECSLSFYEPRRKILLISDATGYYMPGEQAWWPNYFAGYRAYVDSMRRLAGLEAETLCLSHNGAIRGAEEIRAYFRGAIAATEAYHQRIAAEARAGKLARQLAEELGAEIYQKTQVLTVEFFQKNCALLIKQSLRSEGIGN